MEAKTQDTAKGVAQEFLNAVQTGNFELVSRLLHPEIRWNQPGNHRFSGFKSNAGEVFQMVGEMMEMTNKTLTLADIKSISINGNSIACLINWTGTNGEENLNVDNIDVYKIENGQITEAVIYSADIEQEDQFWGSL